MVAKSAASLLSCMADLELQTPTKQAIGMWYGPPGGGKTTLVQAIAQGICSDEGRILFVDSSDGWVSLDNMPFLKDRTTRIQYSSYDDLAGLAYAIKKRAKGFEAFEVVVIDEGSSIYEQILDTVLRERLGTAPGEIPLEVPDWTDYRPAGELFRKAIESFKDAGVHVLLVAHSQDKSDNRKVVKTSPSFSPKLNEQLQKLMHVTGYVMAEIGGTVAEPKYTRTVQAQPTALVSAKTRIGALRSKVKLSFAEHTEAVVDWVVGGRIAEDMQEAEEDYEVLVDEIPTDGLPVLDKGDEEDDAPAFVE